MPLINLRTNLTNLKYGKDRPGGGDSGQPFIQFPIEDASTPDNIRRYYEINRTSLDFPVRGGAITQLISGGSGIISSTIDRQRIQEFFKSAPRGKAFIDKQVGLQLSNPRLQVPNALTFAGAGLGNVTLPVTNVYTPVNTLAQVQVMGTGAFFNRHGVFPTIYEAPQQTYAYIAANNNTESTNRLAILKALKLSSNINDLNVDSGLINRLGISTLQDQLFNYQGGPGSVYGIGFTRIFRVTNTEATNLLAKSTVGFTLGGDPTAGGLEKPYSAIGMTYQQLAQQNTRTTNPAAPTLATVQDFRLQLPGNTQKTDYEYFNIAQLSGGDKWGLGIGNPGAPNARVNYTDTSVTTGEDAVNMINPLAGNGLYYNPESTDPWSRAGTNSKDIIKFAFECIDNSNPDFAVPLIFRAFLEGQISDTNQGEYNTFKYLGRGETFRTYQGFDRTIGFTFKVFIQSRQEMLPLYTKLNALISQVYPDYSLNYNLMRGNVVRLTIGDYLYRTPGFLENVNVTIDNSNTPWEIQMYGLDIESDVRELPHMVTVQCSFKPIMDILPRKVDKNNTFVPLIANRDHFIDPSAVNDRGLRNTVNFPSKTTTPPATGIQTNTQTSAVPEVTSAAEVEARLAARRNRAAARRRVQTGQ